MNIEALHQRYYLLFNDLDEASPALPEQQYAAMAKVLQKLYFEDLETAMKERLLEVGVKEFELKYRTRNYVPRRSLLRWNRMAKALLADYKAEFNNFLESLKQSRGSRHEAESSCSEPEEKALETETTAITVVNSQPPAVAEPTTEVVKKE